MLGPVSNKDSQFEIASERDGSKACVYVVIVTYNGARWIGGCLQSLAASDRPVETIVVDNASTDETGNIVADYPNVEFLPQTNNLGFGGANNAGIKKALEKGADFVFLLNQDATVCPDTIGNLLKVATENPQYGILTPLHLDANGDKIDPYFANYLVKADPMDNFYSDLYFDRVRPRYELPYANAAAWLMSRKCLMTVGGFDPVFFMYGEDNDYCERVRWHGLKVGFVPSSVIHHARSQDSKGANPLRETSSSLLYLKQQKWAFRYRLIHWLIDVFAEFGHLLVRRNMPGVVRHLRIVRKTLKLLPQIRRNRERCRRVGAHWLLP